MAERLGVRRVVAQCLDHQTGHALDLGHGELLLGMCDEQEVSRAAPAGGNQFRASGGALTVPAQRQRGAHHGVRTGRAGEHHLAREVLVAERAVQAAGRALDVDRGEDRARLLDAVGDRGDQRAADAPPLEAGVDMEFGDHEGVVEPAVGAGAAQIRLDDGGPPVGAVVGHAVHESDEASRLRQRPERTGAGVEQMPVDDMAAHLDLVVAEPEGEGLHREGFVDPRGEIDRADHDAGGPGSTA